MTGMGRPKHFEPPTAWGLLLLVVVAVAGAIIADWLTH